MPGGMVIVGAGHAGVQAAEALRAGGFPGPITLLGDEPHAPYHRPPLSKNWLAGEMDAAQLILRAPAALARKRIELRTGVTVTAIDRATRTLRLADGESLPYDGLVLATGASARTLALPGARAPNVLSLRTRDDADAIAARFAHCARAGLPVVVVGGGFIGLEVAATARRKNLEVIVVEALPRLMARVVAPMLSESGAALHRSHGVQLLLGAQLQAMETDAQGMAVGLRLGDGRRLPAGLVVVGVGVTPNDALARAAGLECDRGIVVDDCARTADPAIVAAGDCTVHRRADGSLVRLESVHNAIEQGRSAAAALLGSPRPITTTPWFWSDQYDRKLQIAGLAAGADRVVQRGSLADPGFSLWHFQAGRLIAVDAINAPADHLLARRLLDAGLSPTPSQAGDATFLLASLLEHSSADRVAGSKIGAR